MDPVVVLDVEIVPAQGSFQTTSVILLHSAGDRAQSDELM